MFGQFITLDNAKKLLVFEKSSSGVEYILKRLYDKGCLNTYTILLNNEERDALKKREIIVFAFSWRTNIILNDMKKTRRKPTKIAVHIQNHKVDYFSRKFANYMNNTIKKNFYKISPDEQDRLLFNLYRNQFIDNLLLMDYREMEKRLQSIGYYDWVTINTKNLRKKLKKHFEINKSILISSEEYQDYKAAYDSFKEIKMDVKGDIYNFIKRHQYNDTMISFDKLNEYASKELE